MPFRLQGFQSALRAQSGLLRNQQRRWAQVHDVRFLASHHDPKYVLDKYRAKLDQKAKEYVYVDAVTIPLANILAQRGT